MYGAAIYVDRRAPVRLIQEVFAIAGGCFRILVDAHEDRLKQSPAERHDGMESAAQSDYSLCAGKTGAIGTTSPDQAGALTASPARGDDNSHLAPVSAQVAGAIFRVRIFGLLLGRSLSPCLRRLETHGQTQGQKSLVRFS